MLPYGGQQLAAAFRTVRGNTIRIAEDIPEDRYDWRPTPDVWTIGELLAHIAGAHAFQYDAHETRRLTTLAGYDFGELRLRTMAEQQKPRTKAELLALLRDEGEKVATWLASFDDARLVETVASPMPGIPPRTRLEMLMSIKEHEMHHRGQLMLMQRMLGMVPHLTRAMQERAAARR
jgi:uncharacterized damage-inducible protein DinB